MLGDESCPECWIAWSCVTVQLGKVEVCELCTKGLTKGQGQRTKDYGLRTKG